MNSKCSTSDTVEHAYTCVYQLVSRLGRRRPVLGVLFLLLNQIGDISMQWYRAKANVCILTQAPTPSAPFDRLSLQEKSFLDRALEVEILFTCPGNTLSCFTATVIRKRTGLHGLSAICIPGPIFSTSIHAKT